MKFNSQNGFTPQEAFLVKKAVQKNANYIKNKEDSLRKIVDVEITQETEANILFFEKDFENKDFELSKILVFMSVPVEQGATSSTTGYFALKSENHGYNENSYGSVIYKTTTAFVNLFDIVSNIDGIPTFANINDQIVFTPNLVRYSKTTFGTIAPGVEYGKINGIRLNINSGNFISGTKIVIYGA